MAEAARRGLTAATAALAETRRQPSEAMMKLALVSDIHGNLPALRALLADAKERGATRLAFLGDYCVGLAWPGEVASLLRGLEGEGALAVSGNGEGYFSRPACLNPAARTDGQFGVTYWCYDSLTDESRAWLAALREERVLEAPGAPAVRLFHRPQRYFDGTAACRLGTGDYALGMDTGAFTNETFAAYAAGFLESDALLHQRLAALPAGVYAFGHTHIQWQWRRCGHLLVNPGSCGEPLDFRRGAAYALLEQAGGEWRAKLLRVPYDVDGTVAAVRESAYARAEPVWSGVVARGLETAREQALSFLRHAEAYANGIGDAVRPYSRDTWSAAYRTWVEQGLSKG